MSNRSATRFVRFVAIVGAAVFATRCGSGTSPSATTAAPAVSSVALNTTSIAVGSNGQGTVSLTGAATTAVSVSVTSSNPAVAAVQTPVTIPVGASSASITVTGMSAGTATITAALNGTTKQSPTLTVTTTLALSSISLSPASVVGGSGTTGTATLTGTAPTGGAVVALTGADPATVPPSVSVPAGATSATFPITTRTVGGDTTATIGGSYGGVTASAVLTVTRPTVATAKFGVRGPTETETCELSNNGTTLSCTFDGTTSTAPGKITAYDWSYGVSGQTMLTQTTTGPVLDQPAFNCTMMPAPPLPAGGNPWFTFTVTLKIHDDQGNVSAVAIDSGARLLPQGSCGF
jgi:hypothetical protein